MGNEFFGFSPEAFEQFVRALSLCVFGPGTKAFGNGPDGGREAIFRGEVPYPYPPATRWSGYGVIQAKCKEKPESTEKDQNWALKLLEDELKTFVKSQKRSPKPEYYVFVTNVELSSAAKGWDKADSLVRSYYRKLPLKGHAIWDANQLSTFVAKYESLRKRFTAFLTPGDILATMLADIERKRPNAARVLTAFLERELRADEFSRLDQAGNRTDEQLRLARLFFDLPASGEQQLVPPDEAPDGAGRLPSGVLRELLRDGARRLDPKAIYEQETTTEDAPGERFPTRYVLLGGPGSGKSTVGQFLAQIHRAALLSRREPHLLEPPIRRTIEETRSLCDRDGLPWPPTPRYPIRVELNRFAKALASKDEDRVESLERFLLNRLKREHALEHADLLEWLQSYPWLLILDGLDEVPATSNRDAVVKAVNDFLAEARLAEADLFVVATSRQQGYSGEFANGMVAFRHIMPLSTSRAIQYVERYAETRFGGSDPNRAQELVDKVRQSAKRTLTAQLMSSPLQVTFMATVVAARGDPGEDRWQLFANYYQTIYDRERQKAVAPYDLVLSKQKPIIDRLHHDIAFWLQCQGETASNHAASLSMEQFKHLVGAYLAEAGREGEDKDSLVKLIAEAAHSRLVFLTSRLEGELSFEVRSLQEYMASECLMTGGPELIKARLSAIAPIPYWRNVFLFASGKCFADAQSRHLQDTIRILCEDLNNPGDRMISATRTGSEIAIDVLQSGAVAENHAHARHLAKTALELLAQPYLTNESKEGAPTDHRLSLMHHSAITDVYRRQLELHIGQNDVDRTLGAWPLLIRLVAKGVAWAVELADRCWPTDHYAQLRIANRVLPELGNVSWVAGKMADLVARTPPHQSVPVLRRLGGIPVRTTCPASPAWLVALRELFNTDIGKLDIRLNVCSKERGELRFLVTGLPSSRSASCELFGELAHMPRHCPNWLPYILAHQFTAEPSRYTLAKVLRECASSDWTPGTPYLFPLPWPLATCLKVVQSVGELLALATRVEAGELGDIADWAAAEQRWSSRGVSIDDFLQQTTNPPPFDHSIGVRGFLRPCPMWVSISYLHYSNSVLQKLTSLAEKMPPGEEWAFLWLLHKASSTSGNISACIRSARLQAIMKRSPNFYWNTNCVAHPKKARSIAAWLEFFDWLGRSDHLSSSYYNSKFDDPWVDAWQKAFIRDPSRIGLLRLLGRLASVRDAGSPIPPTMLQIDHLPEPRFQLAAVLVRLTQPDLTEDAANSLADLAAALLDPPAEPGADELLFTTAERHLSRVPAISHFLLRLHERMASQVELGTAKCERLLRQVLRRQVSDLHVPGRLQELQLPLLSSSDPNG